ncbi:MAG: mechanosensitive ion channel [Helicobacter sp.]|nr:mechanosensitive ion channel [Helicobacteraceae bacterium]MDY3114321.1 mechanosensitive ion channel [Helicobacter sp.]
MAEVKQDVKTEIGDGAEILEVIGDKIFSDKVQALFTHFENWFFSFLPNFISAIFILVCGYYFAKFLAKYVSKLILKITDDATLSGFFKNIIFVGVLILVIITALTNLGVKTTSIIAVLGTAGLAVALSLKDSLSNLAGGILIIVFRHFKKGDLITLGSITGKVESVNLLQTILITPDNQRVIVPNSSVVKSPVINVNANEKRRMDLTFSVSYTSDLQKTQEILDEIFRDEVKVLKDPAPLIGVNALNTSSVDFLARFFVNCEDFVKIKLILLQKVKLKFDEAGIEIPYNKLDINLNTPLESMK